MARLTYGERKGLPESDFAVPSKRKGGKGGYPIPDRGHARAALQRASEFGPSEVKAEVRAKVHEKYPGMKIGGKVKDDLHKRGHFESQRKDGERGELSHQEFDNLDHGSKHDHMRDRKSSDGAEHEDI